MSSPTHHRTLGRLRGVGRRRPEAVRFPHGRGDEVQAVGGPNQRGRDVAPPGREDYNPNLRSDGGQSIRVRRRDFR